MNLRFWRKNKPIYLTVGPENSTHEEFRITGWVGNSVTVERRPEEGWPEPRMTLEEAKAIGGSVSHVGLGHPPVKCPVCHWNDAVLDPDDGTFQPCLICEFKGWRTVNASRQFWEDHFEVGEVPL